MALRSNARKSKMYAISVTTPVHPDEASRVLKEKQEKAKAAKEKREEQAKKRADQARIKAQEKRKKEAEVKALVEMKYAQLEKMVEAQVANLKERSLLDAGARKAEQDPAKKSEPETEVAESPTKKPKADATSPIGDTFKITVPVTRLIEEAEMKHRTQYRKIIQEVRDEKMPRGTNPYMNWMPSGRHWRVRALATPELISTPSRRQLIVMFLMMAIRNQPQCCRRFQQQTPLPPK